jgi:glycogen debranching enzyme
MDTSVTSGRVAGLPGDNLHPALALADDRTSVLKHGDTFAVFDRYGDILAAGRREQGLYHRDTRFLSCAMLLLNGQRPLLLSSTISQDNALMTVDLANASAGREDAVQKEVIHVLRSKFLWAGTCHERLELHNYGREPVETVLEYAFDADFADIFEVRGLARERRGTPRPPEIGTASVVLGYDGIDGVARSTVLTFSREPRHLAPGVARFDLDLSPGETVTIDIAISCLVDDRPAPGVLGFTAARHEAVRALRLAEGSACRVETANEQFNEWINRSIADLHMMVSDTADGPYVYAGVPWFSAPFGRDGLITALAFLWVQPALAAGVLRYLAATQATTSDPDRDAEPGKILHEARSGEMAATGEIPFGRYYGSVDATPLFVVLAGEYLQATGDRRLVHDLWPNVRRALDWIARYGDVDGDGFIEYARHNSRGLVNQGWKDSADSVFHADGSDPQGPVAICEAQAYVYAAKRHGAHLARAVGEAGLAVSLEQEADDLRNRFDRHFWDDALGTYALALDGHKAPCRVRTSNAGHCLYTGIALPGRAARLAATLMAPDSFSGWGIRTLAAGEPRYNPMSYHNGAVWPHDNAICAAGLARYGFKDAANRILAGMFDASQFAALHRLPELLCGFERRPRSGPTLYPVACSPQSWAAAVPFQLLQAVLGLTIDAAQRQVRFDQPSLPPFLEWVRLGGLRVGQASVDVTIARQPDGSATVSGSGSTALVVVARE